MCPVDLISIDRRSVEQETECLARATVLAEKFMEKVRDTEDHMWKPAAADMAPAQTERFACLCVFKLFGITLTINLSSTPLSDLLLRPKSLWLSCKHKTQNISKQIKDY